MEDGVREKFTVEGNSQIRKEGLPSTGVSSRETPVTVTMKFGWKDLKGGDTINGRSHQNGRRKDTG